MSRHRGISLRGSRFKDISIKEVHTIDVIGKFPDVTPSQVSKELMVDSWDGYDEFE